MRFTTAFAASLIALGAVLGGLPTAGDTDAPQVRHNAVASDLATGAVLVQPMSDHGNG